METYREFKKDLKWWATYLIIVVVLMYIFMPTDNTDDGWTNRSGMALYTDHKTGLQYLGRDGLTPRLDANGTHMKELGYD